MKADDGDQAELCLCYKLRKDGTSDFERIADLKKSGLIIYRHSIRSEDVIQASTQDVKLMLPNKKSNENVFIFQNTKDADITAAEFLSEIEKKKISCLRCRRIMDHALKLLQKIKAIDRHATFGVCDHCILKKKTCCKCDETTKKFFYSQEDKMFLDLDREEIRQAHYDFLYDKSQQAITEREYDLKKPYRYSPDMSRPSSAISEKSKRQDMLKRYYDNLQKTAETKLYDSEIYPSDSKGKKSFIPRDYLEDQLIQKHRIRADRDRIYPSDSKYDVGQTRVQLEEYQEPELFQKQKQLKAEREFAIPFQSAEEFIKQKEDGVVKDDKTTGPLKKSLTYEDEILPVGYPKQYAYDAEKDRDQRQSIQDRKSKFGQMYELDDEQITRPPFKPEEQYTHVEEGMLQQVSVTKPAESQDKTLEKGFMFSFPKESAIQLKIKQVKSSTELIKDTQDMLQAQIIETKRKKEEERLKKVKEKEEKQLAREKSASEKIMKLQQEAIIKQQKQEEAALLEKKRQREEEDIETKEGSATSTVSDDTSKTKIKAKKTKSLLSGGKPSRYELKEHKSGLTKSRLRGLDSTSKDSEGKSKESSAGLKESKARLKGTKSKDLKMENADVKKSKSEYDVSSSAKSKDSLSRLKESKSGTKELKSEGDEPSTKSKELKPDFKKPKSEGDLETIRTKQPKEPKSKELKPDFKKPKSDSDLDTIRTKQPKEPKSKDLKPDFKNPKSEDDLETIMKQSKEQKKSKEPKSEAEKKDREQKDGKDKSSKQPKEKDKPKKSESEELEIDLKNIKMMKTGNEGQNFALSSSKQKKEKSAKEPKSDKEQYVPRTAKGESGSPKEEKKTPKGKKDKEKKVDLELNIKKYEKLNRSQDLMILQLVKLKQQQRKRLVTDVVKPADETIMELARYRKRVKGVKSPMYLNSDLKLQLELEKQKPDIITEMIKGQKVTKLKSMITEGEKEDDKAVKPVIFDSAYSGSSIESLKLPSPVIDVVNTKKIPPKPAVEPNNKGVLHYALSDRTFIEKGWTVLPTEKVVRRMNVYRMRPAHPEFDWFKHNKNKGLMHYDTGERLAEIEDNGRGRWYYKNGRVALEYYDAEELNAQQRFVVYSNGEPDERGRPRPYTILATFDYLGNGIVFDHGGKIRLKYNQTEGVVLDRNIGPASHWKWHTLNDPPVLQQVMIDTQLPHKDPEILKLGKRDEKPRRQDDEEMMAVEFDNFIKEKSKKLAQSFKPFQIKMKALKVNEHFSLKVLDQASVYLIYRDGLTNIKLNIGMLLDNKEIVDTDTAELGEVSNNVERFPARTDSLAGMQKSVEYAQRFERARMERSRKLRPPQPCSSVDKLNAATSRPLRHPLRTTRSSRLTAEYCDCKGRVSLATNVYYDNRLS